MFGIGMQELMIIMLVALVVIGPKKLPEVARTLAKGMRELRRASDDLKSTIMVDLDDPYPQRRYEPPPPRELPERTGTQIKKAQPAADNDTDCADTSSSAAADDDVSDDLPTPAIAGSAAFGAEGTVARGEEPSVEPDPMDSGDHSGMPYGPGSPELEDLLANAKARQASMDGPLTTGADLAATATSAGAPKDPEAT